jgi:hypothetical protein
VNLSEIDYLAWQIQDYFSEATATEAREYAQLLLTSPNCRVAQAMVRRNLYFNWRTVHHGSIRKDLFCDSNHVINSNYCDVYATKEAKQKQYASLLLTSATKVVVYNGLTPIDEWLLSLRSSNEGN